MGTVDRKLAQVLAERTPGPMGMKYRFAVLVPLVRRGEDYFLLYEVRAAKLRRQPGEVCFPGGRMEPGENPIDCALRETWEELGLGREQIALLGELDFVVHRGSTVLYPVLGLIEAEALAELERNPDEVEETFLVPLKHLMETEPETYSYPLVAQPGADFPYEKLGIDRDYAWMPALESGPLWPWEGKSIWGLTGKITRQLLELLKA